MGWVRKYKTAERIWPTEKMDSSFPRELHSLQTSWKNLTNRIMGYSIPRELHSLQIKYKTDERIGPKRKMGSSFPMKFSLKPYMGWTSLDSVPFFTRLRYSLSRYPVFATDREMTLYPRIAVLGYRNPRGISISRAITNNGVSRKMTYRDE